MSSSTENDPTTVPRSQRTAGDAFFHWEHLILLLTPFLIELVAWLAWIWGLDNDGADRIRALWVWPYTFASILTFFAAPICLAAVILFLIARNVWLKRFKRLVLYSIVLLAIPATMGLADGDYLRFKLQESKFRALASDATPCVVFDRITDNFYIGGANFDPYDKVILYAPGDVAPGPNLSVTSFPTNSCSGARGLRSIRHLTGPYYLGVTNPDRG